MRRFLLTVLPILLALGGSAYGVYATIQPVSYTPETLSAYQKALEMVNWSASLSSVCAAQSGIAATGRPIEVLADCANAKALVGAAEAALKPADASSEAAAKPPAKAAAK